jgi:hypothetical protein
MWAQAVPRSRAMSDRMSMNICRDTATSAIWTDIPRIPGRCEAMLVPSGVLSNGKSHGACTAGGQNRQLPAPTR